MDPVELDLYCPDRLGEESRICIVVIGQGDGLNDVKRCRDTRTLSGAQIGYCMKPYTYTSAW
ncbi:predicted protein [Pyrenophora tritici-repentis Pt-1C-BFP]|uniref:Uncharacterized protein n=1 Tax=Pyrenophora tritici-repentis (strain Pt-1C-BFP) TaxID=426418 RepID=B2WMS0_PYRTR|nr:uncharacterized protein PTRG_11280 [Pyrenophora tritici-repentis Pt-1C-BFP]EDU44330.1 predicted protein [Pyrenophora tritici-repentis Pt-1C-BFP]